MEKKWAFCAVYSFIQILFVKGVWEETVDAEESIYALPGSDVNLTCQTQKNGFLVQVQWSKFTDTVDLVALYHPQHGFYCASGNPCESLVTFTEAPRNVLKWSLHLRNMSSSLSGKYQCRFTKFPEGIWTKIYNLLIQPNVIQDEWRTNQTIEGEINQALEIPCFQNISEISSVLTFAWLVEDNGTQETLIAQDHIISNSTWFKDRVRLGANYGLYLSSIQIHDDDRKFSCHVIIRPGKNWTRSSTVKVFEINIINEERKGKGGFLELKSVLTKVHINGAAQSMNLTIWCMTLSPGPANRVWNISSEKISISLGSLYPPSDSQPNGTKSTLSTQSSPANSIAPTSSLYPPSDPQPNGTKSTLSTQSSPANSIAPTSSLYPPSDPQPNGTKSTLSTQSSPANSIAPTSSLYPPSDPQPNGTKSTLSTQSSPANSIAPTGSLYPPSDPQPNGTKSTLSTQSSPANSIAPTGSLYPPSDPQPNGTKSTLSTQSSPANSISPTTVSWTPSEMFISSLSGPVVNMPKDGTSWPVIVAALLLICLVIFVLGVRKWCEYQKEIMKRPPPFKPPPPPIKYVCIQDPTGSDLPCHEMETL